MGYEILIYLTTPGGLTGAPRRAIALANTLQHYGMRAKLCSEGGTPFLQEGRRQGLETIELELNTILTRRHGSLFKGGAWFRCRLLAAVLWQNLRFLHLVSRARSDIVWIRGAKGIAFAALGARLSGRPFVWDVDYEMPSKGVVKLLHLLGLKLSSAVVFQYQEAGSRIFGASLADKYRRKSYAVIPGIEFSRLEPFRLRKMSKELSEVFTLLHVGTICERKNQLMTVRAVSAICKEETGRQVQVFFAGETFDEKYMSALRQEINRLGIAENVKFLGWRDDLNELMFASDLLVMPSRDEGVPNTVQEAMFIGLPVIVSHAGGMPEVVRDGECGWVLDENDLAGWVEKIKMCMRDPELCKSVGAAAADYAKKMFGTKEWGRNYFGVIAKILQKK